MARYSTSLRTTNTSADAPSLEIRSGNYGSGRIVEIGISLSAATASSFAIGKAAAVGITPTDPVTAFPENFTSALIQPETLMSGAVAWATPPTEPAAFFRRINLPAAIGASVVFKFAEGIRLAKNESIVLWNIGEVAAADVWFVTSAGSPSA